MLAKSLTINASRYVDILFVGSNVVTLTFTPSMTVSAVSVQRGEELDSDTLLALTSKLLIIYNETISHITHMFLFLAFITNL